MKLNIQKWGNSAAVRLPNLMLTQLGAKVGDAFEVEISPEALLLRVARPRYKLADLLAEMPEGLPRAEGWEDMPPVGREII
jgi:antitoxin component of MazEF toxin-antitoxin module